MGVDMLKDIIKERNESVYSVSQNTGISYSTLSDIVMDKVDIRNVQARQLYRLAKYFNLTMEYLYENSSAENVIKITNDGSNIILNIEGVNYQYLGPKNLVAFKSINKVEENVIYVDTYYSGDEGIYVEEEYIDIMDVLADYDASLPEEYVCRIENQNGGDKIRLIDEALMVSDGMAISYNVGSAGDIQLSVTNISRNKMFMKVRLSDYSVLETNMSKNMQNRALEAVKRNATLLQTMCEKELKYA